MAAFSNRIHLVHSQALLSFPRDGKRAKITGGLRRSYIPMTMIEKLAMNMAMEAKAARSRMKSVIGRAPFSVMFLHCSIYVHASSSNGKSSTGEKRRW
jgi:hypothetical protein